ADMADAAEQEAQVIPIRAGRRRRSVPVTDHPSQQAPAEEPGTEPEQVDGLAAFLAFVRRRLTGSYQVDEFGFDPDFTENIILPTLRPLYEKWFRVSPVGLHNIPSEGGALIVANHSGTLPL